MLAVWAEKAIDAVLGICACQSSSRHTGFKTPVHVAEKSSVKVTGLKIVDGAGGVQLSGDTHAVRSNSMNSSAFSCALSVPLRHVSGK